MRSGNGRRAKSGNGTPNRAKTLKSRRVLIGNLPAPSTPEVARAVRTAVDDGVRRGAVVGFIMNRHAGTVLAEYSDIHAAAIAQVELPGQVHYT